MRDKSFGLAGLATILILSFGALPALSGPIVSGDDVFSSVGEIEFRTLPNSLGIPIFSETVSLSSNGSPATVHREAQVGSTIDTEIISVDLFGTSTNAGPLHVRIGTGNSVPVTSGPTLGQIINVVTNPGTDPSSFVSGLSSFDVLFEIDFSLLGITIFNFVPATIQASIESIPPFGAKYIKLGGGTFGWILGQDPLTDEPIVQIVTVAHIPVPEPSTLGLLLMGLMCLGFAFGRPPSPPERHSHS